MVGDQAYHCHIVCKLNDDVEVLGEQGVQDGTKHSPLRGPCVEGQHGGCVVALPHHLGAARQEVQDPVAEGGVHSQRP